MFSDAASHAVESHEVPLLKQKNDGHQAVDGGEHHAANSVDKSEFKSVEARKNVPESQEYLDAHEILADKSLSSTEVRNVVPLQRNLPSSSLLDERMHLKNKLMTESEKEIKEEDEPKKQDKNKEKEASTEPKNIDVAKKNENKEEPKHDLITENNTNKGNPFALI